MTRKRWRGSHRRRNWQDKVLRCTLWVRRERRWWFGSYKPKHESRLAKMDRVSNGEEESTPRWGTYPRGSHKRASSSSQPRGEVRRWLGFVGELKAADGRNGSGVKQRRLRSGQIVRWVTASTELGRARRPRGVQRLSVRLPKEEDDPDARARVGSGSGRTSRSVVRAGAAS